MRKKIFLVVAVFCLTTTLGFADKVYLQDGSVIEGKILDRGDYHVTIESGGIPQKYYAGQIERIEEEGEGVEAVLEPLGIDFTQFDNISETKVNLITRFMDISGVRSNIEDSIDKIIKKSPPDKRDEIALLFDLPEIISVLIPVYDNHFSENELQEIVQFYAGPTGKKLLKATPLIMQEVIKESLLYFNEKLQNSGLE